QTYAEGIAEQEAIDYINSVYEKVKQRDPHETEFLQATKILFDSLIPVFVKNRTYIEHNILERIIEPERVISFRVPWVDDEGNVQVNRGYRVQFNSALGPYKRSEEHTSELQSREKLVCRLLLDK